MERDVLWWSQAGLVNVVNKIAEAISRKQRVVCISTPDPRMPGLSVAIESRLRTDLSLDCMRLNMGSEDQSQPIAHLLASFLNVSAVEIGSVSEFASHPGLVDQVLIVDGVDRK